MRDIKFRMWNGINMIDWDFMKHTFESAILNNANVMQFIGLYDKNGKEIYEGDIVHLEKREWDEYWTVEYDESSAKFVVYNQLNSTREFESEFGEVWVEVTEDKRWQPKVIGNIYENPELLTPEQKREK